MVETIFYLEGRGGMILYHFFIYNLGGLYYILNKKYNVRGQPNSSILLEDTYNKYIVNHPSNRINTYNPIKIFMKDVIPFQREAFEIIKDKFELIEELPKDKPYEIVSIYGETQLKDSICDNPDNILPFLRNLFLEKMNYKMIPGKRIFITRNGTKNGVHGKLIRYILNENELRPLLNKYNIEYIQLENYSMHEKIRLFMESEMIISTNSSALTLIIFANINATIIEIGNLMDLRKTAYHLVNNGMTHYELLSRTMCLNYNKYDKVNEDEDLNFILNIPEFETYLMQKINNNTKKL